MEKVPWIKAQLKHFFSYGQSWEGKKPLPALLLWSVNPLESFLLTPYKGVEWWEISPMETQTKTKLFSKIEKDYNSYQIIPTVCIFLPGNLIMPSLAVIGTGN